VICNPQKAHVKMFSIPEKKSSEIGRFQTNLPISEAFFKSKMLLKSVLSQPLCLGKICTGWEGYHESRRCSRDTYPESYITKYTSIRRQNECQENMKAVHARIACARNRVVFLLSLVQNGRNPSTVGYRLQGYLAYKKPHPPRTIQ